MQTLWGVNEPHGGGRCPDCAGPGGRPPRCRSRRLWGGGDGKGGGTAVVGAGDSLRGTPPTGEGGSGNSGLSFWCRGSGGQACRPTTNPRPATSALLHLLLSMARGPNGRRTPHTDEPLGPGADGGLHVRVELRGARRPAPQPQPWGEGGGRVVKKRAVATALIGYERPHFHHLLYHSIAPSISSQEHAQHCHQNEAA